MGDQTRPRVVIIRGDWLCKRDTRYYEPLEEHYDLLGVSVKRTTHDLSLVGFPVVSPWSVDSVLDKLKPAQGVLDKVFRLRSENLMYFFGLDSTCRGAAIIDFAETFHPFCLQAVKIKERTGVKLVARVHENIPHAHSNLAYRRNVKRQVFEHADAFITCTETAKRSLALEGAPEERIHVIPIGVDTEQYRPREKNSACAAELGIDPNRFTVVFAGRLVWEKGVYDLLNAASMLKASAPCVQIVIAGDGSELERARVRVGDCGLSDSVILTGRLSYDRMADLYSIADVIVAPSIATRNWQEQFGAGIVEAMACGKALVVSDCGSIPEVVGDAGLIIRQASYEDLAAAIQRLADDDCLRVELGGRARERVADRYAIDVVAGRIGQLYSQLLG